MSGTEQGVRGSRGKTAVRVLAALGGAAAIGAVAPPASAAVTVTTDRQCYAEGEPMTVQGTGYTPGGEVSLFIGANGRLGGTTVTADPQGAFSTRIAAPDLRDFDARPPRGDFFISANDHTRVDAAGDAPPDENSVAATQLLISQFDADVARWNTTGPARGVPRRTMVVRATGWSGLGTALYAHYLRSGRVVRSVRVGRLTGACGDLTRRMREFPFRPVRPGTYRVVFTASARFRASDPSIFYRRVVVRSADAIR